MPRVLINVIREKHTEVREENNNLTLDQFNIISYILDITNRKVKMTDFSKYKNVTVDNDTYAKLTKLQTKMVNDDLKLSRSQIVKMLVNEKVRKMNGNFNK